MITLSFLKLLEEEGFGTIDTDLFFQKLTLDKKGIYIADIGNTVPKGLRDSQSFELLARGSNDTDGYKKLVEIRNFILDGGICELPAVAPITSEGYTNISFLKPSTITNVGLDAQNRIIYSMTGTILFNKQGA